MLPTRRHTESPTRDFDAVYKDRTYMMSFMLPQVIAFVIMRCYHVMMENEVPPSALPQLDEHDVVAIEALLIRTSRAEQVVARDREELKVINARIASNTTISIGAYEALSKVYGFVEPPEEGKNKWDLVAKVLGPARYNAAWRIGRGEPPKTLSNNTGDDHLPAQKAEADAAVGGSTVTAVGKREVSTRTAILEHLEAAGDQGTTAADLRQHLLVAHGITVHEKTPGMTLYRLFKDGLARRSGRTWYAVQQRANENEAHGGQATGASETALPAQ